MSAKKVYFDTLRSLGFAGISGAYAAVGTPLSVTGRIVCITNLTSGDMIFSTDNTIVAGQLLLPAGSFKLFDLTSNSEVASDDAFVLGIGTQFYVKQLTAPVTGSVYIELVYA